MAAAAAMPLELKSGNAGDQVRDTDQRVFSGTRTSSQFSLKDQLQELKSALDEGLLTEEEFKTAKSTALQTFMLAGQGGGQGAHADVVHSQQPLPAGEQPRFVRLRSTEFGGNKYLMLSDTKIQHGWKHQAFMAPLDHRYRTTPGQRKSVFEIEGLGNDEVRLRAVEFGGDKYLQISEVDVRGQIYRAFCGPLNHPHIIIPGDLKSRFILEHVDQGQIRLRSAQLGGDKYVMASDTQIEFGWKHQALCIPLAHGFRKVPGDRKSRFVFEPVADGLADGVPVAGEIAQPLAQGGIPMEQLRGCYFDVRTCFPLFPICCGFKCLTPKGQHDGRDHMEVCACPLLPPLPYKVNSEHVFLIRSACVSDLACLSDALRSRQGALSPG